MIAVLGGLGAALAWTVSSMCSSRSSRMIDPMSVVAWVMLTGLLVTGPLAIADGTPAALGGSAGAWLFLSGAGNVIGLVLAYRAMRIGALVLVAPLVSTEGAIAAIVAVIAGESLSPAIGAMLGLIVVGVCVASVRSDGRHVSQRHFAQTVGLSMAAAAAFGTSLYATARAGAVLPTAWVVLAARLVGTVALTLPLAATGRLRLTRRALPLVVASGLAEAAGFFSYTYGSRHGIAIAAVLASQVGTFTALGAFFLFHERLTRRQLLGVGTVAVGVACLSALRA